MSHNPIASTRLSPGMSVLALLALSSPAPALQEDVTFSVDWHGPSIALTSPGAGQITEGDLLIPALGMPAFGPLPPPQTYADGGVLGLLAYPGCVGHLPSVACGVEVDALSFGDDQLLTGAPGDVFRFYISTDEYAVGATLVPFPPTVVTEAPSGDSSTDVWATINLPPGPLPPNQGLHIGTLDGDGQPSPGPPIGSGVVYPGTGLIEGNVAGMGLPIKPDLGDTLDALNLGPRPDLALGSIFFSLDAAFSDPLIPGFPNSGSAQQQGFLGGDILVSQGGVATLYAGAGELGLDLVPGAGPDSDDLNALIIAENGLPGFQPSEFPYDWVSGFQGMPSDMVLFSVRRGSALIGSPDSLFGLPIVEGDILMPPIPPPAGLSVFPAIFIAAENLGLESMRGLGMPGDDTNAMDVSFETFKDCNNNGVEDWVDIQTGASCDTNGNSIPDECEPKGTLFCQCTSANAPCGNADASAGCANSTGSGALLDASGTSSAFSDDLVLTTTQMPPNQFGIFFMGMGTASTPLSDGYRCIDSSPASPLYRFQSLVFNTGASGTASFGPGIVDAACTILQAGGCIDIGETWYFQTWFRDPSGGPCGDGGSHSNLSNGWSVLFTL